MGLDEKIAYWNLLEKKFNTTGFSLMQLNEIDFRYADEISRKIGEAMVAKYGEDE